MSILHRLKKSKTLVLFAIMMIYYEAVVIITDPNNGNTRQYPSEQYKEHYVTEHKGYGKSESSWVPHLCPRYFLRDEPGFKLTWRAPVEGNIFFTQTSCRTHLNTREACAVESAHHHHPHRIIQVFMTAPAINDAHPLVEVMMNMNNVKFSWMDLDELFQESPIKEWHQQRMWLYDEEHSPAYVSDAARVSLLWHYGGLYIDLDAITLRPLPSISNFLGRLDELQVTHAVSNFTKGHDFFNILRKHLPEEFNMEKRASIGPTLVTKCIHQYCPKSLTLFEDSTSGSVELCRDITIFPQKMFYPISFLKEPAVQIFETGKGLGPRFFNSTEAYSLHLYNSLTPLLQTTVRSDSILEEVAKRNCPMVYEAAVKHRLDL